MNSASHYTTAAEIQGLQRQGYVLVSDETHGQSIAFPGEGATRTYTVTLKHGTQAVSQDKKITKTIHYLYSDGTTAAPDHTEVATVTQQGVKDLVTGQTSWQSWTNSSWPAVVSPTIAGYTALPATVPSQVVTSGTPNFATTVIYLSNAQSQLTQGRLLRQTTRTRQIIRTRQTSQARQINQKRQTSLINQRGRQPRTMITTLATQSIVLPVKA